MIPLQVRAEDIKVVSSVSADKIGIEDAFYYTISVETDSNQQLDVDVKFDDFPADYLRPSISTSMSTSFMNGRMSSSRTQSHKYTVYPRQEGILNIPQVKVDVNGKNYLTQSHKVEVVAGSLRSQSQSNRRSSSPFSSFFDSDFDDRLNQSRNTNSFVEVEVSKDSVYIGQDFSAKYTYYTTNNRYNISYDMETFEGYGHESRPKDNENWQLVNYKGKRYYKIEITTFNISPQQAGIIKLPLIIVNESRFLNSSTTKSPTKNIKVKELPNKGKSIDFSNAIGRFTVKSELDQSVMYENQQTKLILSIKGKGNFSKILYPTIKQVDGLEILKPKASLDIEDNGQGTLILIYDIIPFESGKFKIPQVSFNYFDDELGQYKTIYSESHLLTVKNSSSSDPDISSNDYNVFFTRNKPYLGNITQEYLLTNKLSYWLGLSLLIAIIIAYLVFSRIQTKRMSNIGYVRRKEALAILKKAIEESKEYVKNKDIMFYTNAQNNLLKFIAKVTRASLQESQQELIKELEKSKVNNVTVAKINSFLTYCEQIKYRPNFESSENILNDFEKFQDIYNEIRNSQG